MTDWCIIDWFKHCAQYKFNLFILEWLLYISVSSAPKVTQNLVLLRQKKCLTIWLSLQLILTQLNTICHYFTLLDLKKKKTLTNISWGKLSKERKSNTLDLSLMSGYMDYFNNIKQCVPWTCWWGHSEWAGRRPGTWAHGPQWPFESRKHQTTTDPPPGMRQNTTDYSVNYSWVIISQQYHNLHGTKQCNLIKIILLSFQIMAV